MHMLTGFSKNKKNVRISACILLVMLFFSMGLFSLSAQAETTYVIRDGKDTITHKSAATDPAEVLTEAGLLLNTDDTFTTFATEAGAEIVISRSKTLQAMIRGEETTLTGFGETVEELLNENGIALDEYSVLSVPADSPAESHTNITLDQVVASQETYTSSIPFETSYQEVGYLKAGEQRVLEKGTAGQLQTSAAVTYKNGIEENRTILEETVISQPSDQLVAVGTGKSQQEDLPIIGDSTITLPNGDVLTYYKTGQFLATAYTQTDAGCNNITATGSQVHVGVVAVDPEVIPYGTRMFIVTNDGSYIYGLSTAEDCGGAIVNNRLDLYMDTTEQCFQFGVRDCTVYFLGDANWR